jgi:hypothetical protein
MLFAKENVFLIHGFDILLLIKTSPPDYQIWPYLRFKITYWKNVRNTIAPDKRATLFEYL